MKSLTFDGEHMTFSELLHQQYSNERIELGVQLLKLLFETKKLMGKNKKGFFQKTQFEQETFGKIWNSMSEILTQKNQKIKMDLEFSL